MKNWDTCQLAIVAAHDSALPFLLFSLLNFQEQLYAATGGIRLYSIYAWGLPAGAPDIPPKDVGAPLICLGRSDIVATEIQRDFRASSRHNSHTTPLFHKCRQNFNTLTSPIRFPPMRALLCSQYTVASFASQKRADVDVIWMRQIHSRFHQL